MCSQQIWRSPEKNVREIRTLRGRTSSQQERNHYQWCVCAIARNSIGFLHLRSRRQSHAENCRFRVTFPPFSRHVQKTPKNLLSLFILPSIEGAIVHVNNLREKEREKRLERITHRRDFLL